MNTGLVLQCRSASTRFPQKAFVNINGSSLLTRCIEFMKRVEYENLVPVVATTSLQQDNRVNLIADNLSIQCYRGPSENVLERFWDVANLYQLGTIVRLTGDNPFIDFRFVEYALKLMESLDPDCPRLLTSRNTGLALGLDVEVLNFKALEIAMKSKDKKHQEHVTSVLYENSDIMITKITAQERIPNFRRLTIDYESDLIPACQYATQFDVDFRSLINPKMM